MAEKGAQRSNDRGVAIKNMRDDQYRRGALEHVAEQGRDGEALAAGAQNIGGADIAGADRAQIRRAGEPRQQNAERNRAAQIAEHQNRGVFGYERPVDRHGGLLVIRHPEVAAKRPSKDTAEAPGPSPQPKSGIPDFGILSPSRQ